MPAALTALKLTPRNNPDTLETSAAITGSYTSGGDPFSIAAKDIKDPKGIGVVGPNFVGVSPPRIGALSNGSGYYAAIVPGTSLSTSGTEPKLQWFDSEGNELTATTYPDAIKNGTLTILLDLNEVPV